MCLQGCQLAPKNVECPILCLSLCVCEPACVGVQCVLKREIETEKEGERETFKVKAPGQRRHKLEAIKTIVFAMASGTKQKHLSANFFPGHFCIISRVAL